jgi:glycosyltransferase involved in cell wall biosynthesis
LYTLCDHLIIHSHSGKEEITQLFHISSAKISVIPHGNYNFFKNDTTPSKEQAKAQLGIPTNSKTILFFGAIRPNKGLENILHAMALIKAHLDDIKLLIVGEPCEDYNKYTMIIEENHLHNNVYEKLDYVPHQEVALYFSASDMVVLPYHEITQSGVLQIAYAFGKPVVATAIGGFNESVEGELNGYLVPPNDTNALAEKIITLMSDKSKIDSMGTYSRYLSETKYSWDTIATQTLKIYSVCT